MVLAREGNNIFQYKLPINGNECHNKLHRVAALFRMSYVLAASIVYVREHTTKKEPTYFGLFLYVPTPVTHTHFYLLVFFCCFPFGFFVWCASQKAIGIHLIYYIKLYLINSIENNDSRCCAAAATRKIGKSACKLLICWLPFQYIASQHIPSTKYVFLFVFFRFDAGCCLSESCSMYIVQVFNIVIYGPRACAYYTQNVTF